MPSSRTPRTDPRVAVAYLRVSTDEQRLGPEAQRAALEQHAARYGLRIVAWHCDQGVSGAAPLDERPGLLEALESLRQHRAGALLVAKRDRLARDVVAAAMVEQLVSRAGARVVSAAGEGSESDEPAAVLMRRLIDAFSEYERAIIRARTRAALGAKRARGERAGTVPFGYVADAAGRLAPHEGEQAAITRARTLRAEGVPFRGVVERLEAEGFRSRRGRPLGLAQVAAMVRAA